MSTALKSFDKIDVVYGHNDPVAYGAYLAAKDAGREKKLSSSASMLCLTKVSPGSTRDS